MYLKMKGVKEVYTANVSQTLKKHGVLVSPSELINILQNASFVSDISGEKIAINGKDIEVDTSAKDEIDDKKKDKEKNFDMDKYKVSSMAKRSLNKKD